MAEAARARVFWTAVNRRKPGLPKTRGEMTNASAFGRVTWYDTHVTVDNIKDEDV